MAKLGYSDSQIQLQGRWRSESYLKYLKLGRGTRLTDQYDLATKISGVVAESVLGGGTIA